LRENPVRALTEPHFDVESFSPLRAKATVVVQPAVQLGDYRSITREATPVTVADEEVDNVLEQLREGHAEWVPVERPAEMGDRVAIDVRGVAEGRSIVSQDDVEYLLRAESAAPVPGFAEQLVGIAAGEARSFTLTVPAEADDEELAGKDVVFDVTANDVKAKELPELDDYFASTVGSFADLAELRQRIEEQLREQAEFAARRELETAVIDEAVNGATVAIPEKLLEQQAQRARERLARDLDTRGLSIEQYLQITRTSDQELETQLRADAERSLRRSFVLQAIAAEEGIEVDEADVDTGIREALTADGGNARDIGRALRQPEIRDRVRSALLEQQTAKWLIERALGPAPEASADEDEAEAEGEKES
jgi:trigger factor